LAKESAVLAADNLLTRYHEKAGFIQAWGTMGIRNNFRLIVDCLLNIPLLYWAASVTGDEKYDRVAYTHFNTTIDLCCRPDASTYHTYYFDPDTNKPTKGVTHQGLNDESAWARGQAWGIYGPMLTYIYKKDEKALSTTKATANYYLNHLPEDYIAFWDLCFTDGDNEPRDSSSNAIALCGILEMIKHLDDSDPMKRIYENASARIMNSLIDNYLTKDVPESNGLLLHATYSKPANRAVDEMNIWGDYFYMEALHRMLDPDWKLYW
jgi:unsaturated chondroitin disaccharide hydrolase